jgi:methionyl-tRNA synthetase
VVPRVQTSSFDTFAVIGRGFFIFFEEEDEMSIFIGGAWPYANGSLHLGHISSLLPGDILARYYRLKGESVLYVSGSDCNGTPIAIRAKQEGVTPQEIADHYHEEFKVSFEKLGFTYDCYTRTDTPQHHEVVQAVFIRLLDNKHLYKKEIDQAYCETCEQFLPDRYVEGICPHCGEKARGDQCDACSTILDPLELLQKSCKLCGQEPISKKTEHFYFRLSAFQKELERYVRKAKLDKAWRANAIQLTERYLKEGLHDRAVSRDLPNGVSVPVAGYEDKKIYVWIEAVSGYYSASKLWALENNQEDKPFWENETKSYYIHGKDNIPFHSIIWPSILIGIENQSLPSNIVSNEYLTIEKKKLSTSKNWAVWVPELLENYHPDSIRYFLTINAPENRDTDFSWREFILSHNSELLGAYGNLVNRTFKFIEKFNEGELPQGGINPSLKLRVEQLYKEVGSLIESTHFKQALETIFEFVRSMNKYFDDQQPWKQKGEDQVACNNTLATCVHVIGNLAQMLSPFLPFSSTEIYKMLGRTALSWEPFEVTSKKLIDIKPLFERIDPSQIEIEVEKLNKQSRLN